MKLNYCPECAAQLEKKSDTDYICANGHPYWNNAKTAVAVAFCKDEKLLVSQRGVKSDPNYGKFDLPGGFVNLGESAYEAAIREVKEELNITLQATDLQLVAVYQNDYSENISSVDITFVVTDWKGDFEASHESLALEWKPYDFIYDADFCETYDGLDALLPALASDESTSV